MELLRIRGFRADDAEAARSLYRKSLNENRKGFVQDKSLHGDIEQFAQRCKAQGGTMFVALLEDQLIGFGGLQYCEDDSFELCKLHINSDFQGQGFGKALCSALITEAKKMAATKIKLHVTKTQSSAIKLYRKLGFSPTKQELIRFKHNHIHYEFDTLFMELRFKPRWLSLPRNPIRTLGRFCLKTKSAFK